MMENARCFISESLHFWSFWESYLTLEIVYRESDFCGVSTNNTFMIVFFYDESEDILLSFFKIIDLFLKFGMKMDPYPITSVQIFRFITETSLYIVNACFLECKPNMNLFRLE